MLLTGEIKNILYKNELNGFKICLLKTNGTVKKLRGTMPYVELGDFVEIEGVDYVHPQYGKSIDVQRIKRLYPQTLSALKRYLASGKIKGVGEFTANAIIEKFKMDSLEIIRNEPEKLATIKGISFKKAQQIQKNFVANEKYWELQEYLDKFGLGPQYCTKAIDILGDDAKHIVEQNPYALVDISKRVDFFQIDTIAQKMGVALNSDLRILSATKYLMGKELYEGNCFVDYEILINNLARMLNLKLDIVEDILKQASINSNILIKELDGKKVVYFQEYYNAETNVARRLIQIRDSELISFEEDIKEKINQIEKRENIELSKKQKEAIESANENNVLVITRRPGTGKTTIIKSIIEIYEQKGLSITLAAPTGRAAKRMEDATGYASSTLHRLLEIGKLDDDETSNKNYDYQPIDSDIVIVDEMSMVDIFLMNYLVKALPTQVKLILVGDKDQLNSVGPGNVLKDIIESQEIKTIKLDKIFRQAAKSKIIQNAHKVNTGQMILHNKDEYSKSGDKYESDFFFLNIPKEKILDQVLSLSQTRLKTQGFDFMQDIQILSPTKRGSFGVPELNAKLQEKLNPSSDKKMQLKMPDGIFREGDRVMQTKNNYNIEWDKDEEQGSGIYNGEIGIISKIDEIFNEIIVEFDDGKIATYEEKDIEQLALSYATTIHKAQGSEYPVVIMVVADANPFLLNRNLLYTGITRAKKMMILISNSSIIEYMIKNVDSRKRQTALNTYLFDYSNFEKNLQEKIIGYKEEYEKQKEKEVKEEK